MPKDFDKLKPLLDLEKLSPEQRRLIEQMALSPEQKLALQRIGYRNFATEMREAEQRLRQAASKPKYDAPRRNVLCYIMRELLGGPPDHVSTYKLMMLIKPLWAEAWSRLYPERKVPRMPGKGTVTDARKALKNLPR